MSKKAKDNLGDFTAVMPLTAVLPNSRVGYSHPQLEDLQAVRMWRDLRRFINVRYPQGRSIVFANVFLTIGAAFAARAGVKGAEIAAFVAAEQARGVVA